MSGGILAVTANRVGTVVTVAAEGELDIATVPVLREVLTRELADDGAVVVIDLTGVSFVDSSGVHALLAAAVDYPGRVRIVPSAACLRIFEVADICDRLPLAYLN